jgi:hypothetical protein
MGGREKLVDTLKFSRIRMNKKVAKKKPISTLNLTLLGKLGLNTGVSSLGVPWHPQILADQLTLSQPGGLIMPTTVLPAPPDF